MEMKQIKELMAAMEKAGIRKLRLKEKDEFEIELERKEEGGHPMPAPSIPHPHVPPPFAHPPRGVFHDEKPEEKKEQKVEGKFITSPMVGTVYQAPSPDDPPFVKVGQKIDENTVVCIIEAMKVMNEVKAGISGTVAEILVENAHPVEFGTKIFRVV